MQSEIPLHGAGTFLSSNAPRPLTEQIPVAIPIYSSLRPGVSAFVESRNLQFGHFCLLIFIHKDDNVASFESAKPHKQD